MKDTRKVQQQSAAANDLQVISQLLGAEVDGLTTAVELNGGIFASKDKCLSKRMLAADQLLANEGYFERISAVPRTP